MRVVFVTHNELGRACIKELLDFGADVQKIFTKPPDPSVSDQVSLDAIAENRDVDLRHVDSINDADVLTCIEDEEPELLFVVGWSELIDGRVLDTPSVGAFGMHPSPLPRGRGRAPIAWSLIKGLDRTALSFFHLAEAADAGDLVGQEPIPIDRNDDASDLYEKVVSAGRSLIREYYPRFVERDVPRTPQNPDEATWWPKRVPDHGLIDWNCSASEVYDWIRGQTHPYPGAFSQIYGHRVRIWGANPPAGDYICAAPGTILERRDGELSVAAWEETIEITTVQVDEGPELPAAALITEYGIEVGDRFRNARDVIAE